MSLSLKKKEKLRNFAGLNGEEHLLPLQRTGVPSTQVEQLTTCSRARNALFWSLWAPHFHVHTQFIFFLSWVTSWRSPGSKSHFSIETQEFSSHHFSVWRLLFPPPWHHLLVKCSSKVALPVSHIPPKTKAIWIYFHFSRAASLNSCIRMCHLPQHTSWSALVFCLVSSVSTEMKMWQSQHIWDHPFALSTLCKNMVSWIIVTLTDNNSNKEHNRSTQGQCHIISSLAPVLVTMVITFPL